MSHEKFSSASEGGAEFKATPLTSDEAIALLEESRAQSIVDRLTQLERDADERNKYRDHNRNA